MRAALIGPLAPKRVRERESERARENERARERWRERCLLKECAFW